MSSLDIKIVLLLHEPHFSCLSSSSFWSPILCIILMFLHSYYFILRLRPKVSYFPSNGGHKLSANQNTFFSSPEKDSLHHIKLNSKG